MSDQEAGSLAARRLQVLSELSASLAGVYDVTEYCRTAQALLAREFSEVEISPVDLLASEHPPAHLRAGVWSAPLASGKRIFALLLLRSDWDRPLLELLTRMLGNGLYDPRRAQERCQAELTRMLFEQSPVAICVCGGPEHRYLLANQSYVKMVNKRDFIGRPLPEVFPEVVGTPLLALFDHVFASGEPYVTEEYAVPLDRDGDGIAEECFFTFNLVATRDAHGAVTGWTCTAAEITQQVRARREAEAARTLLETVIGEMHTGVLVAEPSGQTLFANRALRALLDPASPEVQAAVASALRGTRVIDTDLSLRGGRTLSLSATPVDDASGTRLAAVVALSDVTERRMLLSEAQQARAQAERANRAKDEFLAMLGHELRNPLAPITTSLYLMEKQGDTRFLVERATIERQVDHLVRLVDDLLDVSRVTSGKIRLRKRPVELGEVVAKAVELVDPLLRERAHQLSVHVPPRGLVVYGDVHRLAQVVTNLLTNAVKYTPDGGQIAIDAQAGAGKATLTVRDTGMGISAEMLPRVFELFVQERQALDRARGGLGLGLAIVRGILTLHDGTVSAHSEGAACGSAFVVTLPLATQAELEAPCAPPSRPLPPPPVQRESEPGRILVVDDNRDAALTLAEVLCGLGQQVEIAYDGPSALLVARELQPTLALLDIGLPGMDGYRLAAALRAQLAPARVRLVALTGYGQASDRDRAFAAGFDAHVVKPLRIEVVETILEDLAAERA
jgi:signal transduction histidine kinase/CheY-like chemotaxis protein